MAITSLPQFTGELYDAYKMRVLVDEITRQFGDVDNRIQAAASTGGGGGGVTVHNDLTGRSAADCHPISAITGLTTSLAGKAPISAIITDHGSLSGLGDDDHGQYILVAGTRPFTGTQLAQNFNPVSTGGYSLGAGYLVGALDWERINSNTGAIMRVQGLGTTSATNIRANSNAIGCTVQAGNASATAYMDLGSGSGGQAITNCLGAAAFATPAGSTCVIEMFGTSGTNLGSAVNVLGSHAASTARVNFNVLSSGSMNLGSAVVEGASALAEIIIIGDGVFNSGNCRELGGTITLSADTVVNLGTLKGGTLTISGESSFNLGTVRSATMTIGGIGSYNMARISDGALSIPGSGCLNLGSIDDASSAITLTGDNVQNFMSVTTGAVVNATAGAVGSSIKGFSSGLTTISATQPGVVIQGYYLGGSTINVTASATGAILSGSVDLSGSGGAPGITALTAGGPGAVLFGSVSAAVAGTGTSTITSSGTGSTVFAHIPLSSASPALVLASNTASFAGGACASGSLQSTGVASFLWGYATGTSAQLSSSNNGSVVLGYANATSTGSSIITSSGQGSLASAFATNSSTGAVAVTANGSGSVVLGAAVGNSTLSATMLANTTASVVIGRSQSFGGQNAILQSLGVSAVVIGDALGSILTASGNGSLVQGAGRASFGVPGSITATGNGSKAMGYAFGGTITAGFNGSTAMGYALFNGTLSASPFTGGSVALGLVNGLGGANTILASGDGSLAVGYAVNGFSITASQPGAIAAGDTTNGSITASAANASQFGPGVNSVAISLQVGDAAGGTGVWLVGSGLPAGPVNGQIWKTAGTNIVTVQSAGVALNLYQQSAYTLTYATPLATHAARLAVAALTDSTGGATDGTIATIAALTSTPALTDSTGGATDGTIATIAALTSAAVTDSTTGTADGTCVAISGSGDDANINNNFADVIQELNADRSDWSAARSIILDDMADLTLRCNQLRTDWSAARTVILDDLADLTLRCNDLRTDQQNTAQVLNQLIIDLRVTGLIA